MRYFVDRGTEVRTENAALPINQLSSRVVEILRALPHVAQCADYGTGKGRYAPFLVNNAEKLHLVDSTIQSQRKQRFGGDYQSLEERYRESNAISVINTKQFIDEGANYDRVALLNVLPVVPIAAIAEEVLKRCCRAVKVGGEICVAVNYRNSEYKKSIESDAAKSYQGGYLIDGYRGHYFLRLLPPPYIDERLNALNFEIEERVRIEGTVLYIARKL